MQGIGCLLSKAARFYPNRIAIADKYGEITYKELNDRCNRIANALLSMGLKKGNRVGFVCDNCNEFSEFWLAVQKAGLVSVLLNYRMTKEELSRDIRRSGCKVLFYAPKWIDIIAGRDPSESGLLFHITFGEIILDGHMNLDELRVFDDSTDPWLDVDETDYSTILYTSGSTGLSKGVVRTHRMIYSYAMQMAAEHEFYKTEIITILSHSPLFHTGGLSMLLKSLALCGTYIGVNGIDTAEISQLIEKYTVTQLFLVPPVNIMRLYADSSVRKRDLSSVNFIWATGGKMSVEYVLAMIELFPGSIIKTSYGATEFCAACSISHKLTPDKVVANPEIHESVGYIGQFIDARVVGDDGMDVPVGEPGELWVSSPFVMLGYLDEPKETNDVLIDGWYHTGDIFRIDEEGLFYFLDRKSAMIKTGGENVYPTEVESTLRAHPDILDCAVVGLLDYKWGEAVAAAIVPKTENLNLNEIIQYSREKLAGFKKPLYYTVLSELPRTASGKIDRGALLNQSEYSFTSIEELTETARRYKK